MRAAPVADQQRVALRVIACALRPLPDLHQAPVGVLSPAGRNAFGDDGALGVAAEVDHLRAGVGLLPVVGHRHRVELANRVVALEDAARILPGDRRAGLDLRPGNLRADPLALATLGHEVVDAALAILVTRIPVLDGRILDRRVVERDQLDDRGVQLMLVAHRRRAAFEVAHIRALIRDDERALELARGRRVDAEIGRQLHRAANTLRNVGERPVGEDRRVQPREEVVRIRYHRAEVLSHKLRVLLHRLRERAEDNAELPQLCPERRPDRHAVEDRVHRDPRQQLLFLERNPELLEGPADLRIDLIHALEICLLRRRVVDNRLIVNRPIRDVRPRGLLHRGPQPVGLQSPLEQPVRLLLLLGDRSDGLLAQPTRDLVGFDIAHEAVLVLLRGELLDRLRGCAHFSRSWTYVR